MAEQLVHQGYFSILRWRHDAARDEARNVAVVLVDPEGQFGGVRAAPLSRLSPRLHEQGLLDALVAGLEHQFVAEKKPDLASLQRMQESLERSVYLTELHPVAVTTEQAALDALYKAYVKPRAPGGGAQATKGAVLDKVVETLRSVGLSVRRGEYIRDFIFDAVVERAEPLALSVLSFASSAQDFVPAEKDAGHFLYALTRLGLPGTAVVRPPTDNSHRKALESHARVLHLFDAQKVPVIEPADVRGLAAAGV